MDRRRSRSRRESKSMHHSLASLSIYVSQPPKRTGTLSRSRLLRKLTLTLNRNLSLHLHLHLHFRLHLLLSIPKDA
jgi:hypothetical protein